MPSSTLAIKDWVEQDGPRAVDPAPFLPYVGSLASNSLGKPTRMEWLPISSLRIDPVYQREVLGRGAMNVGRIAREFDWSKFGVVIVAPMGGGLYAIVDGQHRTISAACRGVERVPCLIIDATPGEQAAAFAAINGATTKISSLQIFNAKLAAGDDKAKELAAVCLSAGVRICRYPVAANNMKVGDTLAVSTLVKAFRDFGPATLTAALKCITDPGPPSIGLVGEAAIKALCNVLDAEQSYMASVPVLLQTMRKFDLRTVIQESEVQAKQRRVSTHSVLTMRLYNFLDGELG